MLLTGGTRNVIGDKDFLIAAARILEAEAQLEITRANQLPGYDWCCDDQSAFAAFQEFTFLSRAFLRGTFC
jgi:hypothetical protein